MFLNVNQMVLPNYKQLWFIVLFLGMCTYTPLSGQSEISQEFIFKAYKSISLIERFKTTRSDIVETYLTFHPVSISNDSVGMFLCSTFTGDDGKKIVESGRIIYVPITLLPDEPLQSLVQPLVIYLNDMEAFRTNVNFRNRFSERELNSWKACGYNVQNPAKIGRTIQYR